MKKLILIAIACFLFASCDNVNFNTAHLSFDGTNACVTDTVIVTVDSSTGVGKFLSPNVNATFHGDTMILTACESIIKK